MGHIYIETPYISSHMGHMYIETPYISSHMGHMYIETTYSRYLKESILSSLIIIPL